MSLARGSAGERVHDDLGDGGAAREHGREGFVIGKVYIDVIERLFGIATSGLNWFRGVRRRAFCLRFNLWKKDFYPRICINRALSLS